MADNISYINIIHLLTTQNFWMEFYDSFLFTDLILFDSSSPRPHSIACCLKIIQVFIAVQTKYPKLSALLSLLPFLYIPLALCLLLCVYLPVGGQHLPQPWLCTNEEHRCTEVLFVPELLLGNYWSVHSDTNAVPGCLSQQVV